jgi:oxygen-independent coproporphyrinogen-3 oxidase
LYIHVPFCARKCAYCAFYSEVSSGEWMDRYVLALIREMEIAASDLQPLTIFFGGGTPTLLNSRQWKLILAAMNRLNLLGAAEWTVECNPATVSADKAKLLRDHGVNRVSMGVQSLDETLLKRLGRIHTRTQVFRSFEVLREAGFDNLNLDLMFGIPGQTLSIWRETLAEVIALGSEHLSCYEVIYEEDTPLFAQRQRGEINTDEDLACALYEELIERAETAGVRQYEIANFARDRKAGSRSEFANAAEESRDAGCAPPGASPLERDTLSIPAFACQHNVNYWRGGSFVGLGPGATTYVRGVRTKNCSNIRQYCEQLEQGNLPMESREELPPLARAGETAAFGLRMVAGWPFEEFRHATGHDLRGEWSGEMSRLTELGWGRIAPDRFHLTRPGLRFADAAAEMFLR